MEPGVKEEEEEDETETEKIREYKETNRTSDSAIESSMTEAKAEEWK